MPDPAIIISSIGLVVATIGGAVALYNARKAVSWKRADLANMQLKELLSNEELTFACRCLDWNGGQLVVPRSLRPLLKDNAETIDHDRSVFAKAVAAQIYLDDMADEPRLQIYRTAMDTLLSWLSSTDSAIERNLYGSSDIEEAEYWLQKACEVETMAGFIDEFGYRKSFDRLARRFRFNIPPTVPQITRRGFGDSARGRSVGG
jgi:hypothetical protein